MRGVYPVFIKHDHDMYLAYIPDIDAMTQGKDLYEAVEMARDLLGTHSLNHELPEPSDTDQAMKTVKEKADEEDFAFSDGFLTLVDIDTIEYQHKLNTRSVRRNVSLPAWLNEKADAAGLNVSRVLQEALIKKLR